MPGIRAFIAIDLSPELKQRLDEVLVQLRQRLAGTPIRWVSVTQMHVTLKFLGDVPPTGMEAIQAALSAQAAACPIFDLTVAGLGAFPNVRRARVLWTGVQAPPALISLQAGIDTATARLGYASEERAFSPHLTLGRVEREAGPQPLQRIQQLLETWHIASLGTVTIDKVRLYRSDLRPGGPIYTPLFTVGLAG